ncbi:hypothetical protein KC326_g162 [Hortaea werneckii]|nr:hypothetical protein KC326_g162 [Hortaea werneckii]
MLKEVALETPAISGPHTIAIQINGLHQMQAWQVDTTILLCLIQQTLDPGSFNGHLAYWTDESLQESILARWKHLTVLDALYHTTRYSIRRTLRGNPMKQQSKEDEGLLPPCGVRRRWNLLAFAFDLHMPMV